MDLANRKSYKYKIVMNKIYSMEKINVWLKKPFPFYENIQQKLFIPTFFTLIIVLGIIILNYSNKKYFSFANTVDIFGYGLVVILVSLLFSLFFPAIFPKLFDPEKWNIQKTLIFLIVSVITIGIVVGIIAFYKENPNTSLLFYIFRIILRSIILSILPLIILVFIAERRLYKQNNKDVIEMMKNIKPNDLLRTSNHKFIFAKNTKDEIIINENNLFFIKAEGNYCYLFYEKKGEIKKSLIRTSLKSIENIVSVSNQFIRCHKSYVLNLEKVNNVTGNAKGYTFYLIKNDYKIPVSRNISKSVIEKIKHSI